MGAQTVSECYSDLVLRIPWYVAWPLLIAFGALALQFVAVHSVYFPVKHPEGFWNLQAQLGATDVWLDSTDDIRIHGWLSPVPGAVASRSSCTATPATSRIAVSGSVRLRLPAPLL